MLPITLHDHQRGAERRSFGVDATLRADGQPIDALIANISTTGCLFVCSASLEVGDQIKIGIGGIGRRDARIVRAEGPRFGAAFDTPLTTPQIEAAALAPDGTVVAFPMPFPVPIDDRDIAPAAAALSPIARCATIIGMAAAAWGAVAAVAHSFG